MGTDSIENPLLVVDDNFPAWKANFLSDGLATRQIRRIVFEDGEVVHEERLIQNKAGRACDVAVGPDGLIYLVTDNGDGNDGVWRVSPAD